MTDPDSSRLFTFRAIGVLRTPFADKVSAPRQGVVAEAARGTVELHPDSGMEHAVQDLEQWDHVWIVYVFHLAEGFRPKVLPPRSDGKRKGVLATRSPHRPNPIGLTAVRLLSVSGLTLEVQGLDMVDGTPVLDIKPYVPYADAIPDAKSGWLGATADPIAPYEVAFTEGARAALDWLADRGVDLTDALSAALALGPEPHPYRRIRKEGEGYRIAVKEWRAWFTVQDRVLTVTRLGSGHRARDAARDPALAVHVAFTERFD